MNAELKAKWIAALRSGDYKQGRMALRSSQGGDAEFCCLGVLCDIAQVPMVPDTDDPVLYNFNPGNPTYSSGGTVHGALRAAFGNDDILDRLIIMNDKDMASFTTIADYIEQHIPVD